MVSMAVSRWPGFAAPFDPGQGERLEPGVALDHAIDAVELDLGEGLLEPATRPTESNLFDGLGVTQTDLLLQARATERATGSDPPVDGALARGSVHHDLDTGADRRAVGLATLEPQSQPAGSSTL